MKKILVSIAFVAMTAGSAFAQGGAITVNGIFTPGPVSFGSVSNSATQSLTTTVTNNSPASAGNASAATGAGNNGTATALSAASTVNTQTVSPTNYISFSTSLAQHLNY
ncbi:MULTISPECIES: hypothetical protein [Methylocystis]|uniref:Uncharacterized protein n=1 Tax=Methylocystis iwaonis TaxID=2885079 RepID=A0ABN6VFY4_9HYPH|nr:MULTISPECIES: hypothetical protein [Methylocystis]MBL1256436.1 hypothetical protein [Methylocystis sp. Sn-Cys]MDJ0447857.1 hypothetical protein [Methylocystis sp. JR02]BDV34581.1 hypothetical protein SS37A_21100 [Methylocystis iwaonis]